MQGRQRPPRFAAFDPLAAHARIISPRPAPGEFRSPDRRLMLFSVPFRNVSGCGAFYEGSGEASRLGRQRSHRGYVPGCPGTRRLGVVDPGHHHGRGLDDLGEQSIEHRLGFRRHVDEDSAAVVGIREPPDEPVALQVRARWSWSRSKCACGRRLRRRPEPRPSMTAGVEAGATGPVGAPRSACRMPSDHFGIPEDMAKARRTGKLHFECCCL